MVHKQIPKKSDQEFIADRTCAQILLKTNNYSIEFLDAKKLIEESGIHIIEMRHLSPNQVLLKLDVTDMRDIALKLTEHGFFIEGINASCE